MPTTGHSSASSGSGVQTRTQTAGASTNTAAAGTVAPNQDFNVLRNEITEMRRTTAQLRLDQNTGSDSFSDLGLFQGDYGENFDEFFEHFELMANANDWTPERRVKN